MMEELGIVQDYVTIQFDNENIIQLVDNQIISRGPNTWTSLHKRCC